MKTIEELESGIEKRTSPKHGRLYVRRAKAGLCVACGKVPSAPNSRRCADCKRRYPGGGDAVTFKEWRKRKISEGLCSRCGREPHAENRKLCMACLKISLDNANRRLAENPNVTKDAVRRLFLECLDAYGGRFCICCGVDELLFLSLDHINNDGAAHRKAMGQGTVRKAGSHTWFWLKKHGFPLGMQVLCMNCNTGKQRNGGICPHKMEARK